MSFKVLVSTRFFDPASEKLLTDHRCTIIKTGLPFDVQDDVLDTHALHQLLEGADGWNVQASAIESDCA